MTAVFKTYFFCFVGFWPACSGNIASITQPVMHIFFYFSLAAAGIFLITTLFYMKKNRKKRHDMEKLQRVLQEKERAYRVFEFGENNLYDLVRVINEGFICIDDNDKISYLNDKACHILGGNYNDLINKSIYDFLHGREDAKIYDEKKYLGKKGESDNYDLQIKQIGGNPRWVRISVSYLPAKDKSYAGSVSIITDITERKKYDKSMKELTANLNQKIKQLNCLYDISDLTNVPGITYEEIFVKSLDIIPFGLKYTHDTCVEIVFESREYRSYNFEETQWCYIVPIKVQKKKLGHIRVCYTEEKPFINKDPFHFNEKILIKNIAEKLGQVIEAKNMENTLKESKHKLALTQKVTKTGSWEWDLFANRKVFSNSFFNVLDVSIDKRFFFDDEAFFKMIHPDDKQRAQNLFDKILEKKFNTLEFKLKIIQDNGDIKNILFHGDVIKDDNNNPLKLIFTIQDVTKQNKKNRVNKSIPESDEQKKS